MHFPMYRKGRYRPADVFRFVPLLCKYSSKPISKRTDVIREEFVNYFKNHDHKVIRSSPVVPYCDPSVTFVNAGMNQFKSVFLGTSPAPAHRAVNSQKCIRVGGKHNDLEVVGSDGYHHTFFEMLGSWSFGDYFKKEACHLSWEQLTKTFGLNPKRLYVTYFRGEEKSNLEPDLETKEIWLEIGVPENHVLPFGAKDNFWEMGPTGPCGPCTEIHYDFLGRKSASDRVNAGHPDLIELWNIVFIQFARHEDGTLSALPCRHVDTGMGLERLASVLQGVTSTYDTDIFQPLFNIIHKITGAPLYGGKFLSDDHHGIDTGYRILSDHARMITVAIADGMLPDHNHRLRRVIRRSLSVGQDLFLKRGEGHELLYNLCACVAESLEGAYPGIVSRLDCIKAVLVHEEQMLYNLHVHSSNKWSKLISKWPQLASMDVTSSPGMVQAFEELEMLVNKGIPLIDDRMAFVLYDTYGLNEDMIQNLGKILNLNFNANDLARKLDEAKIKSRKAGDITAQHQILSPKILAELQKYRIPSTDDKFKYQYYKDREGQYQFEPVDARIEAIIYQGKMVRNDPISFSNEDVLGLILDRTCFYNESGGQVADTGSIFPANGGNFQVIVKDVEGVGGYIVHWGQIKLNSRDSNLHQGPSIFKIGDTVHLSINEEQRLRTMMNHTAVHCLGAAIRGRLPATSQRSSLVSPLYFNYQFSAYGISSLGTSELKLDNKNSCSMIDSSSTDTVSSTCFSWQELLEHVEKDVRKVIKSSCAPVRRRTLTGIQLIEEMAEAKCRWDEIATVPGEVYPESGVHLIEIMVPAECLFDPSVNHCSDDEAKEKMLINWSREPCCGTHLLDATDIQEFSIISVDSAGSGSRIVKAVTGPYAVFALSKGKDLLQQVEKLGKEIEEFLSTTQGRNSDSEKYSEFENLAASIESKVKNLNYIARAGKSTDRNWIDSAIPYVDRCKALVLLEKMEHTLRERVRALSHSSIEQEMLVAVKQLETNQKFLVYWIQNGGSSTDRVLQKATKCCPANLPVLLFAAINGGKAVKARCVVPQEIASENFNAKLWMKSVMDVFKSGGKAPKGQDPHLVFNMSEKKLPLNLSKEENKEKFNLALKRATDFAKQALYNYNISSSR